MRHRSYNARMLASDRRFAFFNAVVSVAVVGFLGWLLVLRQGAGAHADLGFMPAVNAALNATATLCLIWGYRAIRRKDRATHQRAMVLAFAASTVFFIGYILYHYAHGDTPYPGTGPMRIVYFAILISHVLLSIVMLPMILTTFYLAATERFQKHRRLARWTLPIWLYVSVTGVVIYLMLRAV